MLNGEATFMGKAWDGGAREFEGKRILSGKFKYACAIGLVISPLPVKPGDYRFCPTSVSLSGWLNFWLNVEHYFLANKKASIVFIH